MRVLDDDIVKGTSDDGAVFLVMELLEGESVMTRAHKSGGRLPEQEVLTIAKGCSRCWRRRTRATSFTAISSPTISIWCAAKVTRN